MERFVYCIIKIPKVAEQIPQSCMRNFPIIAEVFDICLNLYQMYRFRQISNIHCRHTVIFCILKIVVADNNLRRRKEYDCNGQGTFYQTALL